MSDVDIGLVSILFVLVTVYVGIHVGVALSLISFVGVWIIQGDVTIAGKLLALAAAESRPSPSVNTTSTFRMRCGSLQRSTPSLRPISVLVATMNG